jgi:hypothetical protein
MRAFETAMHASSTAAVDLPRAAFALTALGALYYALLRRPILT